MHLQEWVILEQYAVINVLLAVDEHCQPALSCSWILHGMTRAMLSYSNR